MREFSLTGKKVLLIMPDFYNYAHVIKSSMEKKGAEVDLFYEEPRRAVLLTFNRIRNLLKSDNVYSLFNKSLYRRIKKTGRRYDYFLVIRGGILNDSTIDKIKSKLLNQGAKSIYYTWDALQHTNHNGRIAKLFDKKYSFDSADVKIHPEYELLPLFYSEDYDIEQCGEMLELQYDLCCIASFSKERYEILSKIKQNNKLNCYFRLYIDPQVYQAKLLVDKEYFSSLDMDIVTTIQLTPEEVREKNIQSKAMLDISHNKQSGLSIRILESIGLKRKLVTDNPYVKEYDFYNENDIYVFNVENLVIPKAEWFGSEYEIDENIRNGYSIDSWVEKILG